MQGEGGGSPDIYPSGSNVPIPPPKDTVKNPPGESNPAQTLSPEQQEIEENRANTVGYITQSQEKGVFTSPQARSAAELAIQSGGQDTKAVLAALRTIGVHAWDAPNDLAKVTNAYNAFSEGFEITVDGKTYNLSELETERSKLDPSSKRRAEIEKIIEEGLTVELTPGKAQDQAVTKGIESLRGQIEARKANGERVETYEDILNVLVTADNFRGKARAFVVDVALRRLWASGLSENPSELDEIINQSAGIVGESELEILKHAVFSGFGPEEAKGIAATIRKGDFAFLRRIGYFAKPGVSELFFGKELTDAETAKLLGLLGEKRKLGKDQALMVLLMALVGVTQATRQAVMGELPRQR